MINKFLILLLVLLAKVFCFGQSKQIKVIGPKYTCVYNKTKGMLNGLYTSYYNNGCEKAQGKFENNTRMGTWTLWDSTGNMIMQRKYDAPFQYSEVFPIERVSRNND